MTADGRRRFRTHDHRSRRTPAASGARCAVAACTLWRPEGRHAGQQLVASCALDDPVAHPVQVLTRRQALQQIREVLRRVRTELQRRLTAEEPGACFGASPFHALRPHPPLPTASSSPRTVSSSRRLPPVPAPSPRTRETPSRPPSCPPTAPAPRRATPAGTPCFPHRGNASSPPAAASAGTPGILRAAATAPSPTRGSPPANRPATAPRRQGADRPAVATAPSPAPPVPTEPPPTPTPRPPPSSVRCRCTPPNRSACSNITKSVRPAARSREAMPSPPRPAPRMAMS